MRANAGFTVIELLIVVTIAGLMAAFSLPKLGNAVRVRSVGSAADLFVLTHSYARTAAMRYGRTAELHVDAANAKFWVMVDTAGTGVAVRMGSIHDAGDNTAVHMTSTRGVICFDARGLAAAGGVCEAGNATIAFSNGDKADTVRTSVLGKVLR